MGSAQYVGRVKNVTTANERVLNENNERREVTASWREPASAPDAGATFEEGWFRTIAENLPQLVWTCDIEGVIDFLNSQSTRYTGVPSEQLIGMNWREYMEPDDRERTCDYWLRALRGEVPYDLEYRLRHVDGQYRWFKARATPLRNLDRQITKWFGTCTDIHDNEMVELKLRESEEWLRLLVGT